MRPLAWSLLVVGGAIAWAAAKGQDLSAYLPYGIPGYETALVPLRPHPRYDPVGLHAGTFTLHPQLEEGLAYDSNVFGAANGAQGSWVLGTHPSLQLGSTGSHDSIGGFFSLDDCRYLNTPSQSRLDWTGSLGGTLDVGEDKLTLAAAHLRLHQDRTQLDAVPSDEPVGYQLNDVRASYAAVLGRVSLVPALDVSTYNYEATTILGLPASQSYRDRVVVQGGLTAKYELATARNLVVVLRGLDTVYTQAQPGQPTRDSTGWIALAGIDTKLDGLWRIRVLAGWEERQFAAAQYGSHSAPVAEADVVWSPSRLTTVTATLARTIEDAAQEGVAGYTYTTARLTVDYDYRPNVLLQGFASVQQANYLQGGGSQVGTSVGGSVTWLLNRHMRLQASDTFAAMRGSAPSQTGGSYNRNMTLLTLGFGL